jgi:S-adenosylmethionine:tRNA ribosyltransferase-isomerase
MGSVAAAAEEGRPVVRLEELDYDLPPRLIAQRPAEPRDAARLLVHRRAVPPMVGGVEDRRFADLPSLLRAGDLLVRNDTRVLAARTFFRRPTGGRLEILFLHGQDSNADAGRGSVVAGGASAAPPSAPEQWEALVRGRPRAGETLTLDGDGCWQLDVLDDLGDGRWLLANRSPEPVVALLERHGCAPLPPYIRAPLSDAERYQTVFACRPGSAAAPTAGLHFTRRLDKELAAAGVQIVELTLHVGLGTFRPLGSEVVEENRLHAETFELTGAAWQRVLQAKADGRRVVAVGTTMVRLLEHLAAAPPEPSSRGVLRGGTSLFITPGYRFRVVDALVTNFHLPRTSLLALVMAFCGMEQTRALYTHAVAAGYRFYSFGDAMLVS